MEGQEAKSSVYAPQRSCPSISESAAWSNPTRTPNANYKGRKVALMRWNSNQESLDEQDPPSLPSTPVLALPTGRRKSFSAPVATDKLGRFVRSETAISINTERPKNYVFKGNKENWKNYDLKRPSPRNFAVVSSSWFWSDQHLKHPSTKQWKRDYRSFTHSVYLPPYQLTHREKEELRWKIKCRAWINSHQQWMH